MHARTPRRNYIHQWDRVTGLYCNNDAHKPLRIWVITIPNLLPPMMVPMMVWFWFSEPKWKVIPFLTIYPPTFWICLLLFPEVKALPCLFGTNWIAFELPLRPGHKCVFLLFAARLSGSWVSFLCRYARRHICFIRKTHLPWTMSISPSLLQCAT